MPDKNIRPLRSFVFGGTVVEVWPDCVRTILPDGGVVVAAPQDTDEYRATAERLGYGADTWRMCAEHELTHSWLAAHLGLPASPTLSRVARCQGDSDLTGWEEDAVLAIQKICQHLCMDLFNLKKF